MPIVSGGIGTTGLQWNSGFGYDPVSGQARAQKVNGQIQMLDVPTDPGGTKNWTPPAPTKQPGSWTSPYAGGTMSPSQQFGGIGSSGSSGSGFGGKWSFGGKSPFATDAAAAKLRDEFARLKKSGKGAMNEDLASRGIFSSGVGGRLQSEQDTQYGLAEGAALEDLYNRSAQQELGFSLEQQRMAAEDARARSQMGSQRYGNANEMQDLLGLMGQQGGGGPIYSSKGAGGMGGGIQPPAGGGAGAMNDPATGEPIKGTPDYFNRWQKWFRDRKANKGLSEDTAGAFSEWGTSY